MYTILDYILYYKDTTLSLTSWNKMDSLICAILSYLPINSYEGCLNIKELKEYSKKTNSINKNSQMEPFAKKVLDNIFDSIRYKDLLAYNFINIVNDKTQFGAITFRINNLTIISYKGSDKSLIGWMENIRLLYNYPTYTQELALKYYNDNITKKDKAIYLTGHSKGGNLALFISIESNNKNCIKEVINFDGPGFTNEIINSKKYNDIKNKIFNILPTNSFVGTLLNNNNNYNIIKSKELGVSSHYPFNWMIFGEYFINGKLSNISIKFKEDTSKVINILDSKKLESYFENVFIEYKKRNPDSINISFEEIINIIKSIKDVNPEISVYIITIINSIFNVLKGEKND